MSDFKKILITGASGFVGQNLVPFLEGNYVIKTLGRSGADFFWGDLESIELDFEAFVHLAGKAHDLSNVADASEYFRVNTDLTKKLFEVFKGSQAEVFIYMSSVKAAADTVTGQLKEDVTPSPKTPYGQSKLKAEEFLLSQKLPPGKRVVILRPCMIHGPGNKGNLNLLYKFVQKGVPYPLAAFENRRSFLSIDNLTFTIRQIIENKEFKSGIYQVADDESLSTNELVELIAKTIGKQPRLLKIPKSLMHFMARLGDGLKLPLNTERLKKLTENYLVSNQKLKGMLGLGKMPVSAREGLKRTIKSFDQ